VSLRAEASTASSGTNAFEPLAMRDSRLFLGTARSYAGTDSRAPRPVKKLTRDLDESKNIFASTAAFGRRTATQGDLAAVAARESG
jgi:hypothetical protein